MKNLIIGACGFMMAASAHAAVSFYPIESVSSNTTNFYPVENLIQGPGVGFDVEEPNVKISGGEQGTWVTDAPGGFPSDYIEVAGPPIITLDLGSDVMLNEISTWGYSSDNSNGVSAFSLRFATALEGIEGFGSSIDYNPSFNSTNDDDTLRQSFAFDETVTARYVEFMATDNFFGTIAGGDRVGLGEIAFQSDFVIPEPSTALMFSIGVAGMFFRRRR